MPPIDPACDPAWDERLQRFPDATCFHTAAWAQVLARSYGLKPAYFLVGDGSAPAAMLPTMEITSSLTGRRGVSLPFSDHCSPLASDDGARVEAIRAVTAYGTRRRWQYWEQRGGEDARGRTPSTTFVRHLLPLDGGERRLFAGCSAAARRAIRKAGASQLRVEFAQDLTAVHRYYELHCATRRRHGLPPQPFRFFHHLQRHFLQPGLGWVVLASLPQGPVAGAVFLRYGRTLTFKFGASNPRFAHLRPNNLVMWEAIVRAVGIGCSHLDFGRTSLANEGLRRFKLGWGAAEALLPYYRYELPAGRLVNVPDRARGWHNRVLRLLPSAVLRSLGAALYRHIG